MDLEGHPLQNQDDIVIDDLDVVDFQQGFHSYWLLVIGYWLLV
jgi:hypothetical protein